ncbi:unnamed protein product [Arctogadus glacialis]
MEEVYQRFNSYDFETDERFLNGLLLVDGSSTGGHGAPGLEMKLFYYNRFVEPIDSAGFKQRSGGDPREVETQNAILSRSVPGPSRSDSDEETSRNDSEETEAKILSFKEENGTDLTKCIKKKIQGSSPHM